MHFVGKQTPQNSVELHHVLPVVGEKNLLQHPAVACDVFVIKANAFPAGDGINSVGSDVKKILHGFLGEGGQLSRKSGVPPNPGVQVQVVHL